MIELRGLTPEQITLANIMWSIETKEGLLNFIRTLPPYYRKQCYTIIECIRLAMVEETKECDINSVETLLSKFRK